MATEISGMIVTPTVDLSTGLEPTPGTYRYRAGKGAPWQPVRIAFDGYLWHVLIVGQVAHGSGNQDPRGIPFLDKHWPMHPIEEKEYMQLLREYLEAAKVPGHPLLTPDRATKLREAPPL